MLKTIIRSFSELKTQKRVGVFVEDKLYPPYKKNYYHFVMSYLLPLLGLITSRRLHPDCVIETRSVGVFDPIIREISRVGLINIEIVKSFEAKIIPLEDYDPHKILTMNAYFRPTSLEPSVLSRISRYIQERTQPILSDVLIIERSHWVKRRKADMSQIESALCGNKNVLRVQLEDIAFMTQVGLFLGAKTIIAQHGSALANIAWCNSDWTENIIEICPEEYDVNQYFDILAEQKGLNYNKIIQKGNENSLSEIEIREVCKCLKKKKKYSTRIKKRQKNYSKSFARSSLTKSRRRRHPRFSAWPMLLNGYNRESSASRPKNTS